MSEPMCLSVYNSNKEFLFGIFNRWGDYMVTVADLKLRLFKALNACSPCCTKEEALKALAVSGFSVYMDDPDNWHNSDEEMNELKELFKDNGSSTERLYTKDVLSERGNGYFGSDYTFTVGKKFRTIDLIWEEECPEEYDDDEVDSAEDMPQVMLDVVTKENVDEAINALTHSPSFYKHDGLYYYMD